MIAFIRDIIVLALLIELKEFAVGIDGILMGFHLTLTSTWLDQERHFSVSVAGWSELQGRSRVCLNVAHIKISMENSN